MVRFPIYHDELADELTARIENYLTMRGNIKRALKTARGTKKDALINQVNICTAVIKELEDLREFYEEF